MAERVQARIDGREVSVKSGDIFGRGRHADVATEGSTVSRKHAQLHRGPSGWFVTDLGSSNGLYDAGGGRTEYLSLPAGTTRFTLGPPSDGVGIEITIPPPMAAGPTIRVNRPANGDHWPAPPPASSRTPAPREPMTSRVGPPEQPPDLPVAEPLGFAAPRPLRRRAEQPDVAVPPQPNQRPGGTAVDGLTNPNGGVTVRADQVTVVINRNLTILQPTSLSLPAGSMTAIVGPSGCVKSTLANLLSGRGEPTAGTVEIGGRSMDPTVRTGIGVVPQYDAVHERLTVRQALRAAARLRLAPGTPREDIDEAVLTTAAVLDLDERLDTRVAKLSGGQKKRVSVGYELVSEPAMMVLDEPTSGLDPGLEAELIAELRALADRGTTTVLVTHSPEAAIEADLVIVLAPGGYLTFIGPPDEVLPNFGVDDWADVFSRLTGETAVQWAEHFAATAQHQQWVVNPPPSPSSSGSPSTSGSRTTPGSAGGSASPAVQPLVGQGQNGTVTAAASRPDARPERSRMGDLSVMTSRYLRSIVSDWRSVLLLSAQAPVLGLLFAAVLSRQVFITPLVPRTNAREFVLAALLAMVWIGASNSVREIVKERRTFLRERAVGVSAVSLVASRWLVLSVITIVQAVVLYYTATSRQQQPLTDGVLLGDSFGGGPVELMIALSLVGLGSVGIGLLISALVSDVNKAMAILPIVLIPVVLFSGLLIPTTGRIGVEQLSWINPVMWGSSAAAVVADVLTNEGCDPNDLQTVIQQALLGRTVSCSNPRWQQTTGSQVVNLGMAVVQLVVLAGLSFVAADRSTRNLRS